MESPFRPESPASSHIWADDSDRDSDAGYAKEPPPTVPVDADPRTRDDPLRKRRRIDSESGLETKKYFTERMSRSVDNFRKLNKIDEGAYGVVYRVQHKKTGQTLALKKVKIRGDTVQDEGLAVYRVQHKKTGQTLALKKVKIRGDTKAEGFPVTALREVDLLLSVHHRNIVNVYETVVGRTRDEVFLVMEFVEHDLRTLMEQRNIRFTAPEVKCLMQQLLQALRYLHEHFILHRDLKTGNILLNNQGILKICDFGMARFFGEPLQPLTPLNHAVTLPYRPPEGLIHGTSPLAYGPAADMWSCGCIFAEILQNKPVFKPTGEMDLFTKMCQLLGTPTDETWPYWSQLEFTRKWKVAPCKPGELRNRFPQGGKSFDGAKVYLTEKGGFDLLNSMLAMCPEKRISAAEALTHCYFQEGPLPTSEAEMALTLSKTPSLHTKERGQR